MSALFLKIPKTYKGGSTLGQGHMPPDSLIAPDSKARWKNVRLYGVRIFVSVSENGYIIMDSVMNRLM